MHSVAAATGLTGFIGRHFLHSLLRVYAFVINYSRRGKCTLYSSKGIATHYENSYPIHETYSPHVFYNLATYYNSHPKDLVELSNITDSNIVFPLKTLIGLNNPEIRIVNLCSYLQLQGKKLSGSYELSKEYFKASLENIGQEISNIFLFDTFGEKDTRNKVVDVFIRNILDRKPITIPVTNVFINISDVLDICASLESLNRIPIGNSCVRSPFTMSLLDLANLLMRLLGVEVEIIYDGQGECAYSNCELLPTNIFRSANNEEISDQLLRRANDIRNAKNI